MFQIDIFSWEKLFQEACSKNFFVKQKETIDSCRVVIFVVVFERSYCKLSISQWNSSLREPNDMESFEGLWSVQMRKY